MRRLILSILLCSNFLQAQTLYKTIESESLGSRELKIQLPRNYDQNEDQSYVLVLVLDGDYLFEIVAGNVDYMSYWDDMPEAIVVGINQVETREDDFFLSDVSYYPTQKGMEFYNFIQEELMDFLEDNYRISEFKIGVGHGASANYLNFFTFNKSPLFQATIALSPDLSENMINTLSEHYKTINFPLFYYLSTASEDLKIHRQQIQQLNAQLQNVNHRPFRYQYDNFDDANHYSLVTQSIPKALQHIFKVYHPISKTEYKTQIVTLETSPVDYLTQKYEEIKSLYGIEKQILLNDFRAIAAAIVKNNKLEYFEELGRLARKAYPDTVLHNYYMGRYFEAIGNPKKAIKAYQEAYIYQEIEGISKDDLLDRADQLRAEFGY